MRNATRYLCAGAYLDDRFRDRVLSEVLGDPYRAVPPSHGGFDLLPVVLHCLRAERLALIRDAVLSALLALSLVLSFTSTLSWLSLLLPLAVLALPRVRRLSVGLRALLLLVIWAPLSVAFGVLAFLSTLSSAYSRPLGYDPVTGEVTGQSSGTSPILYSLLTLLLIVALFAVAIGYWVMRYFTIINSLKPGARGGSIEEAPEFRQRLAYINRAQWGNITLYGNENPFVGSGGVRRSWSIAVELDRLKHRPAGVGPEPRQRVRIDPMDLHAFVHARIAEMRDAVEWQGERIGRLRISDHVAARGTFTRADWQSANLPGRRAFPSHPFLDPEGRRPLTEATPDIVDAVGRHPQGGMRYYQRITVGAEGPEIRNAAGQVVAPAEDQEITVSAFVHLAVEGRMLYTQFVLAVMPPVRDDFHIDELFSLSRGALLWEVVKRVRLDLIADVVFAPFRLVRTAFRRLRQNATAPDPADYLAYPFGVRESVRELGAEPRLDRFTQVLDADKYTKLIEQRLTEAVLDYLEAREVDTSGYRSQAATLINNGALITGGTVNGPVAAGAGATATTTQHRGDA
ncbi:hypothetical protein [Streptosporangium sp. NPDC002721]|uniref:hypothetical protein n=1 Tax=Streptosporangium sp. NPDC002721 TaxID=3366188 RepID=UPI00367A6624